MQRNIQIEKLKKENEALALEISQLQKVENNLNNLNIGGKTQNQQMVGNIENIPKNVRGVLVTPKRNKMNFVEERSYSGTPNNRYEKPYITNFTN